MAVDSARLSRMKQKGWSMLDAGRSDEAIAAFKECIDLDPSNIELKVEFGVVLYKLQCFDACLEVLDEVLKINPNYILALNNKARIMVDRHQDKEAMALYRQILTIDPKHIRTWIKAAQLMSSREKYDKADSCIQEALNVNDKDEEL